MNTTPFFVGMFLWVFADEAVVRVDQDGRLDSDGIMHRMEFWALIAKRKEVFIPSRKYGHLSNFHKSIFLRILMVN